MKSVVAVPIVFIEEKPYLVFIRRSRRLNRHANQIAFPGGIVEHEETLIEAMFRELEEEIGVSRNNCKFLGELSATVTGKSNLFVQAFLVLVERPHFKLNAFEVQDLYFVALSQLKETKCDEVIFPDGRKTCKFVIDDLVIWGATARIVKDSLGKIEQLLEGCRNEFSGDEGDEPG
ncbi:MAG: CoA pyrophosphatase [Pseudothermotoga sp.]|nr:CoA pyrophosphatase [Pseudothermotoga sp.]